MTRTATIVTASASVLALALVGSPAAQLVASGPTAADRAAAASNGPSLSSSMNLEAGPRTTVRDLVALAAAGPADQAAFGYNALKASRLMATANANVPWKQVGTGAGFEENASRGALVEGRLKNTGITLSLAQDPRDANAGTVYVGSGGGLWKTTNAGQSFTQMDIPAVPVGGVGVDPSNPDVVVAATGMAFQGGGEGGALGAYVSHDAGKTWTRPVANVGGNGGQQVSFAPNGTAFVATDRGLWRSTDHGATFVNVQLPTNAAGTAPAVNTPVGSWTTDVRVRPGKPQEVYAAVGYVAGNVPLPDGTPAAPGNGLYRSTAGGAPGSWHRVSITSPLTGWEQNPTRSSDPIGRTRLAFTPSGDALFALVADAGLRSGRKIADQAIPLGLGSTTSLNGLYRTSTLDLNLPTGPVWTLEATSETLVAAPGSSQPVLSAASLLGYNPGIQAWYNGWVEVDPVTPSRVFLGEEESYVSVIDPALPGPSLFKVIDRYVSPCALVISGACPDGTPLFGGVSTHPDQHAGLPLKKGGSTRLWTGNDGGTFYQDQHSTLDLAGFDNESWKTVATYNTLLPYRAVKATDGSVIAGLQDNGTVVWHKGDKLGVIVCGGDGSGVATAPEHPGTFYCMENGALSVTTDGGKTTSSAGAPAGPAFQPAAFTMDPTDETHLMIADTVVYETVRGSASTSSDWKAVFTAPNSSTIEAVDTVDGNSYAAYCAVCSSSVKGALASLDRHLATNVKAGCQAAEGAATCWHVASLKGMPQREIVALSTDPANVRNVYLATVAPSVVKVDFGDPARVVMSSDAGETVKDVSGNLPRGNVYDVKVAGDYVYVAHDLGVFVAKKGTSTWSKMGPNLPVGRVYGLSVSADRKELVASQYGAGVWTIALLGGKTTVPTGSGSKGGTKTPGNLAATGGVPLLAGLGLVALGAAVVSRRRRSLLSER
ncbi:MAG: hypothetical protein JWM40_1788 [Frankiales bacterium]|nr:hypothetical protein [Frankiales bacterium]